MNSTGKRSQYAHNIYYNMRLISGRMSAARLVCLLSLVLKEKSQTDRNRELLCCCLAGWLGSRVKTIAETGQKENGTKWISKIYNQKRKKSYIHTHAVVTADADIHTHTHALCCLCVCVCYGCFYCSCPNWNNELYRVVVGILENGKQGDQDREGEKSACVLYKTITLKF